MEKGVTALARKLGISEAKVWGFGDSVFSRIGTPEGDQMKEGACEFSCTYNISVERVLKSRMIFPRLATIAWTTAVSLVRETHPALDEESFFQMLKSTATLVALCNATKELYVSAMERYIRETEAAKMSSAADKREKDIKNEANARKNLMQRLKIEVTTSETALDSFEGSNKKRGTLIIRLSQAKMRLALGLRYPQMSFYTLYKSSSLYAAAFDALVGNEAGTSAADGFKKVRVEAFWNRLPPSMINGKRKSYWQMTALLSEVLNKGTQTQN
jgi:hypothetical protein